MGRTIVTRVARGVLTGAAAAWLASCHSVGPTTIARDRFDYSTAIGDSWKRQTLLNVVRLRYADPPIFVDVGQVVAGYSLESVVSVAGTVASSRRARRRSLFVVVHSFACSRSCPCTSTYRNATSRRDARCEGSNRVLTENHRDLPSKRVLSFIMLLFSLADRSEDAAKPLITIPAQ